MREEIWHKVWKETIKDWKQEWKDWTSINPYMWLILVLIAGVLNFILRSWNLPFIAELLIIFCTFKFVFNILRSECIEQKSKN